MRIANGIIVACAAALLLCSHADAEPKGKNGEACNIESKTGVSHTIAGKAYKCDKCVYSKCDASGGTVSNCQNITYWSNCVAAAGARTGDLRTPLKSGGVMAPPQDISKSHKLPETGTKSAQ
jgi:hypothetical protein